MSQRYEFFEWELAGGGLRTIFRAHITHTVDSPDHSFAYLPSGVSILIPGTAFREWLRKDWDVERPS